MSAPLSAPTTPYTIPAGGAPVRITDGNNAPAGLTLVNQGANGGTIWISSGPSGQGAAIPLGPGATLQWTDPGAVPYASLSTSSTKDETLLLTGQAQGYANPSVVAAALVAQGIPSTMLDTGYGTYQIPVSLSAPAITVSQSASLVVAVDWPQPTPQGASVVRLRFDDPAIPDLPAIDYFLTNNNAVEAGQNKWQVPVVAPRLTITNLQPPDNNNADAYVQVVGSNRPVDRFRILGTGTGTKSLYQDCPGAATVVGRAYAGDSLATAAGVNPGTGPMTRANGPVTLSLTVGATAGSPGAGILSPAWVDETGRITAPRLYFVPTGSSFVDVTLQWNHPSVPVYWRYLAYAAQAGNYFRLTVSGTA